MQSITEPRNLATLGLYGALVYWTLSAAPFSLLAERLKSWALGLGFCGGCLGFKVAADGGDLKPYLSATANKTDEDSVLDKSSSSGADVVRSQAVWRARVRLTVVAGLLVGPFFPASNVMVYVGTFIGERLLYFPSVGYCWLLAELLGLLLPSDIAVKLWSNLVKHTSRPESILARGRESERPSRKASRNAAYGKVGDVKAPTSTTTSTTTSSNSSGSSKAKVAVLGALLLLLLGGYSGRTFLRCFDWLDNERLFKSALTVCPNSAKVQVNVGVSALRQLDLDKALGHFR